MSERPASYDELLGLTRRQAEVIAQQAQRLDALEAEVARLRQQLELALRQGNRQAAPFRRPAGPKPNQEARPPARRPARSAPPPPRPHPDR